MLQNLLHQNESLHSEFKNLKKEKQDLEQKYKDLRVSAHNVSIINGLFITAKLRRMT